jgi:hypothetical protein
LVAYPARNRVDTVATKYISKAVEEQGNYQIEVRGELSSDGVTKAEDLSLNQNESTVENTAAGEVRVQKPQEVAISKAINVVSESAGQGLRRSTRVKSKKEGECGDFIYY